MIRNNVVLGAAPPPLKEFPQSPAKRQPGSNASSPRQLKNGTSIAAIDIMQPSVYRRFPVNASNGSVSPGNSPVKRAQNRAPSAPLAPFPTMNPMQDWPVNQGSPRNSRISLVPTAQASSPTTRPPLSHIPILKPHREAPAAIPSPRGPSPTFAQERVQRPLPASPRVSLDHKPTSTPTPAHTAPTPVHTHPTPVHITPILVPAVPAAPSVPSPRIADASPPSAPHTPPNVYVDEDINVGHLVCALLDCKWEKVNATQDSELNFHWTVDELEKLHQLLGPLCTACAEVLREAEYPVLNLESPVFIMGDIHGRFDDLQFFLGQFYTEGAPSLLRKNPAVDIQDVRIANNIVVLGSNGEHEVTGLSSLPNIVSASCEDLMELQRKSSAFIFGKDSMRCDQLLFLGDFVDRGFASLEVAMYVMALKVAAPDKVHLLRGNHEIKVINRDYGFLVQCQYFYGYEGGLEVWEQVNRVFDLLPLAAILDEKIFCVHGGIPRLGEGGWEDRLSVLKRTNWWHDIRDSPNQWDTLMEGKYERFKEVFDDLLWADPAEDDSELDENGFGASVRGISVSYGAQAVDMFLDVSEMSMILRAHQMKARGFSVGKGGRVITIFTSSHYNANDNVAGAAFVSGGTVRAITRKEF